jgi:hypothetical protein
MLFSDPYGPSPTAQAVTMVIHYLLGYFFTLEPKKNSLIKGPIAKLTKTHTQYIIVIGRPYL